MELTQAVSRAEGLTQEDAATVYNLVKTWKKHYRKNIQRDEYYLGHVRVKDLGISVQKSIARKLDPHVDWAAKCVDYWADRVQYDGISTTDEPTSQILGRIFSENDMKNLTHMVASSALKHSCAFFTVTQELDWQGQPHTVISGYPATAAAATWSAQKKRISSGMVIVETKKFGNTRKPTLINVFTDTHVIELALTDVGWVANYTEHSMQRVPMEFVAYHATLDNPFGRSRISRTVRNLVDDAQREMLNMSVAASFAAAPQKYLLGTNQETIEALSKSPFGAYIGSIFAATPNANGNAPQFGQLTQLSMQPHTEYMRQLAAQFSNATGVPTSSLGVISDANPTSADAIRANKEDAVVDIQHFVNRYKRTLASVATMVISCEENTSYFEAQNKTRDVMVSFANPAMPSIVSQSDAVVKQLSVLDWMKFSPVVLKELGYSDDQRVQLLSDMRKYQATQGQTQPILGEYQKVVQNENNPS